LINIQQTTFCSRREQTGENRHGSCDNEVTKGRHVPKRDSSAGFRLAMSDIGRPEQTIDDGGVADAKPPCVALVPVVQPAHWTRVPDQPQSRADFVTQLIATAEYAPQTRSLRRAMPADAQAAYRANRPQVLSAGIRTRQII
jgi:hypothetical protein